MQKDRYRDRMVDIDFEFNEDFGNLPDSHRLSIVLVTNGSATGTLNGDMVKIAAPAVLCLSENDSISIANSEHIAAQTFSFPSDFFGTVRTEHGNISTGLSVFRHNGINTGLFMPDRDTYSKIREWFSVIGTEVFAQSDSLWVCRIKKHLLQILGITESLCSEQKTEPVNLALDYIHINYYKKISLDELCRKARTNRISLNRLFKERYGCTAIEYLNSYRLQMAEKILTYTRMNLAEVAHATGFEYDTYFIRQFTRWKGMSPTRFRKIVHQSILGNAELTL